MCGRFEFNLTRQTVSDYYQIEKNTFEFEPSLEVFPTQEAVNLMPDRSLEKIGWGFQEPWTKKPIINTRLETADIKPTSAESFAHYRCVIPVSGFFEWDAAKQKYHIHTKGEPLFSLAGIYKIYQSEDGIPFKKFSILTQPANPEIRQIHDRMPVIVPQGFIQRYLTLDSDIPALKKSLLHFKHRVELTPVI